MFRTYYFFYLPINKVIYKVADKVIRDENLKNCSRVHEIIVKLTDPLFYNSIYSKIK